MDEHEIIEPTFIHTHIVGAFSSVCVLLLAMLMG